LKFQNPTSLKLLHNYHLPEPTNLPNFITIRDSYKMFVFNMKLSCWNDLSKK